MPTDSLPQLSPHEVELLNKALPFAQAETNRLHKVPSVEDLRIHLTCRQQSAERIRRHIIGNKLVDLPPAMSVKEENTIDKDTWKVSLPRTHIHTLEQLMEYIQVDTNVWEVERWEANKWEMGYVARNEKVEHAPNKRGEKLTTQENESGSHPLFQVKATFKRKHFSSLAEYAKENAKLRARCEKQAVVIRSEKELSRTLAQNHAGYDDILANMKEFASVFGDLQLPKWTPAVHEPLIRPVVAKGHTEDAVLLFSDTHYGDQIRREDTSGFPEYDLVIAGNRTGYIAQQAKQILTLHRAMYPLKTLHIWIGGDIGNGDLHDAPQSNELFLPAQVHFSYHMIKFLIEDLLTLTVPDANGNRVLENINLLFTVGNHMRMDEKMPTKLQAQRTLDWLIYQFVIERFTGIPNVTIRSEMSPYIFENIRGHRHLFAHGMQVGYKNSPDAQCKSMGEFISRVRALFDSPEWRRKNNLQGETFERACIGDIHVPVSFPRLLSNGSLNGQNELGVNWMLEPIPAGMQLFGVADRHAETWKYFLACSHIQREAGDFNDYGRFAADYSERVSR